MMSSIKELLNYKHIKINPHTEKEVEQRFAAILKMRATIDSQNLAGASICLVNTAGKNHI